MRRYFDFSDRLCRSPETDGADETQPDAQVVATEAAGEEEHGDASSETPAPSEQPKPAAKRPWFEQRIGTLTAQKSAMQAKIQELQSQLAQLARGEQATDAEGNMVPASEVEKLARELAAKELNERLPQIQARQAFDARCNAVFQEGLREYGQSFAQNLQVMQSALGENGWLPDQFLEAVLETDEPHVVINSLAQDMDTAAQLLSKRPAAMAAAVAKYATTLGKAQGEEPKGVKRASAAPPPIPAKVGGTGTTRSKSVYDDDISIEEWMELRKKQLGKK